jgi:hypothetical protein
MNLGSFTGDLVLIYSWSSDWDVWCFIMNKILPVMILVGRNLCFVNPCPSNMLI